MLQSLMKDDIEVLRADGASTKYIGSVHDGSITVMTTDLIEADALVIRHQSNGGKETYRILDPQFHEQFHSIPARYTLKVQKLGLPEARAAVQSITYNVSGPGARVNHHSTDNSINITHVDSRLASALQQLREEIERADLDAADADSAKDIVDELEAAGSGNGRKKRAVLSALVNALPAVGQVADFAGEVLDLITGTAA